MPAKSYYISSFTNEDKEKEIMEFYEKQLDEGKIFNFQSELVSYCEADVTLLREGCLEFLRQSFGFQDILRQEFGDKHEEGSIPYLNAFQRPFTTIGSYAYALFKIYGLTLSGSKHISKIFYKYFTHL